MRSMKPRALVVCVLAWAVGGCTVRDPQLAGVYRADYPFGFDVIQLRPDGTFTQSAEGTIDGVRRTATLSGTWKVGKVPGAYGDRIRLEPFLLVEDGIGRPYAPFGTVADGGAIMAFGREWGVGRLYLGGGNDYPHRRVD